MNTQDSMQFVSICTPNNSFHAGMIRAALESAGINVYINNESFSQIRQGGIGIGSGSMAVMVPENEAEKARQIIDALVV